MLGITAFLLILDAISSAIVIIRLSNEHNDIYIREGSPWPLWSSFKSLSFSMGYLGLREYRHDVLDKKTVRYCDIGCIANWLVLLIAFPYIIFSMWSSIQ